MSFAFAIRRLAEEGVASNAAAKVTTTRRAHGSTPIRYRKTCSSSTTHASTV